LILINISLILDIMTNIYAQYSDAELITLYQKELQADIVGELYKRYALLVYGLCFKYLNDEGEAEDAVSEIFELLLSKLQVQEINFFKSWLFIVSKNHLIRKQKKKNDIKTVEIEKISENFMENEEDVSLNIRDEQKELLRQAISNLNEEQRTCIELFYYQQKPYQEVASMTGYNLNKVKSAIQNGKRNLKLFMEEKKQQHG